VAPHPRDGVGMTGVADGPGGGWMVAARMVGDVLQVTIIAPDGARVAEVFEYPERSMAFLTIDRAITAHVPWSADFAVMAEFRFDHWRPRTRRQMAAALCNAARAAGAVA